MAVHLLYYQERLKQSAMKRMNLCAGILLMFAMTTAVQAQQKNKSSKKPKVAHKATVTTNKGKAAKADAPASVNLTSTGEYKAYGNNRALMSNTATGTASGSLSIADPTIRTFNAIANGANIRIGSSGVIGVPKGRYGYANGHLTLLPNGATSIGTNTGSGSVGTGSSPGSVGTIGPGMGVNGRNPYAGPDIRGTRVRSYTDMLLPDSIKILPLPRQ